MISITIGFDYYAVCLNNFLTSSEKKKRETLILIKDTDCI